MPDSANVESTLIYYKANDKGSVLKWAKVIDDFLVRKYMRNDAVHMIITLKLLQLPFYYITKFPYLIFLALLSRHGVLVGKHNVVCLTDRGN